MFLRVEPSETAQTLAFDFDGSAITARKGDTVAAALFAAGILATRTTAVSGAKRGPYCMMGVCFDCLVEIDGVPNRQACMTSVTEGMRVRSQSGREAPSR